MVKVSVIVPVYNAEGTLSRCLESVLGQSFSDFEVLVVDDGSTDSSALICKEYAQRDARVRFFQKMNGGVSSARNYALDRASGEYVAFCDSDDYYDKDYLGVMLGAFTNEQNLKSSCEQNLKENNNLKDTNEGKTILGEAITKDVKSNETILVISGVYQIKAKSHNVVGTAPDVSQECGKYPTSIGEEQRPLFDEIGSEDMQARLFTDYKPIYHGYVTNKIFKKSIIDATNLRFNESLAYNEDRLFVLGYLKTKGRVRVVEKPLYNYVLSSGNAMSKLNKYITRATLTELDSYCLMLRDASLPYALKVLIADTAMSALLCFYKIARWNKTIREKLGSYYELYTQFPLLDRRKYKRVKAYKCSYLRGKLK